MRPATNLPSSRSSLSNLSVMSTSSPDVYYPHTWLDLLAGQINLQQSICQRGSGDFDAVSQDEAAQKLSRRDATVKERFAVCVCLTAANHQLAVLFGDAKLFYRKARHRERYANAAVFQLFDIVGRVGIARRAGGAFQEPFQMVEAQKVGTCEDGLPVHVQPSFERLSGPHHGRPVEQRWGAGTGIQGITRDWEQSVVAPPLRR